MPQTVLAADDNTQTLQLIRSTLQRRYKVWTFRDPYQALTGVQEGVKPQLVPCNYRLFGMTGSELRRAAQLSGDEQGDVCLPA
jgi:CheY-like chemotaxis protein